MKFLTNRKLASRIGIITTAIIVTGMTMLWFIVSGRGDCKFFCVYGGKILPIRFRYVPYSVELLA